MSITPSSDWSRSCNSLSYPFQTIGKMKSCTSQSPDLMHSPFWWLFFCIHAPEMKASSLSLSLQFSLFLFWQMNLTLWCSIEHRRQKGYVCLIFCPLIYCCLIRSIVFSWKFQLLMGSLSQWPLIVLDQRHQRGRWLLEKGCKQDWKDGLHVVCACRRWMCSEAFSTKGIGYSCSTGHESNTATGPGCLVL